MSVMNALLSIYDSRISVRRGYAERGAARPFSEIAGINRSSISNWRKIRNARLDIFEAVANALGYRLVLQDKTTGEIVGYD